MVALAAGSAAAQSPIATLPYSSELGYNYGIAPDWENTNAGPRGSKSFEYDRNNVIDYPSYGFSVGICHPYDSDYAANCWVISPYFQLETGKEYTVSFWTATRGADREKFELRYTNATERTYQNLAAGTQLINNSYYLSPLTLEKQEATFTVAENGAYTFGIHCYSDADSYTFFVTGFDIREAGDSGDNGDDPGNLGSAEALPFSTNFETVADFDKWTSVKGPNATINRTWAYNSYSHWAELDGTEYETEDFWFVSPELNFAEAGNYAIDMLATIYGSMDVAVVAGTDQASLDAARVIASYPDITEFDKTCCIPFEMTETGNFRIALHCYATTGSYMGYRLNSFKVKRDLPVPALVEDLVAIPDLMDALQVNLSWTNPSLDNKETALSALTKVELLRNGQVVNTINNPTPGSVGAYLDEVPAAGVYTYSVMAYNANGCIDVDPIEVKTDYVGRPQATMPYNFNISNATEEQINMFSTFDGNNDGTTWQYVPGYWGGGDMINTNLGNEADDYIATPYLTLAPGYYRIDSYVNANENSYEVGIATNRHDLAGTYTKLAEFNDVKEYGYVQKSTFFEAPTAGDYLIVIRHVGPSGATYYNTCKFTELKVTPQDLLPAQVSDLTATETESGSVEVSWTLPAVDIVGNALADGTELGYKIFKNDYILATQELSANCAPGQPVVYTDNNPNAGLTKYTVKVFNVNGEAEGDAPTVTIYTGEVAEMPMTTSTFNNWNLVNGGTYWNKWSAEEGPLTWDGYSAEEDYAFSPYFKFNPESDYLVRINVTADPYEEETALRIIAANEADEDADIIELSQIIISSDGDYEKNLTTRTIEAYELDEPAYYLPAGKQMIGFVPNSGGTFTINSFHIEDTTQTGVTTIMASAAGIRYSNGVAYFPANARDIVISNVAGQVLFSAEKADNVRINTPGVIIISATIDGRFATLKIRR